MVYCNFLGRIKFIVSDRDNDYKCEIVYWFLFIFKNKIILINVIVLN